MSEASHITDLSCFDVRLSPLAFKVIWDADDDHTLFEEERHLEQEVEERASEEKTALAVFFDSCSCEASSVLSGLPTSSRLIDVAIVSLVFLRRSRTKAETSAWKRQSVLVRALRSQAMQALRTV
jgi:hypothetical protein